MKFTHFHARAAMLAGCLAFAASASWAGTQISASDDGKDVKATKEVAPEENWLDKTIEPVTSPMYFEDPVIHSEIRPIFAFQRISNQFVTQGGNAQVYALQLRWAPLPRFEIIATKDGYININPKQALPHQQGWANIAFGVKYALIDDRKDQFIFTPGVTLEVPTGGKHVFQGEGNGIWNFFFSTEKGFGNLHATGNFGLLVPNDGRKNNAMFHYAAQLDYYCCQWFIPFAAFNGYTVVTRSKEIGLDTEGYDLINFGSSQAFNRTQGTMGFGFRSRLLKQLDFGMAYDFACITPKGLERDRWTFDLAYRF